MFSSNKKRILSIILIIAMILSSAGMTTFAASLDRIQTVNTVREASAQKNLSSKYYEQMKAESKKLLLADDEAFGGSGDIAEDTSEKDELDTAKADNSSATSSEANEEDDEDKKDKTDYKDEAESDDKNDADKTDAEKTDIDENENRINDDIATDSEADENENTKTNNDENESDKNESNKNESNDEKEATTSDTEFTATDSEVDEIEVVNVEDTANDKTRLYNGGFYGTVKDSDKYEWSSNWWTDLGFNEDDKKDITKIEFLYDNFGHYWQDAEDYGNEATADKEPIEWKVLATKSNPDRTLIVSKKTLLEGKFDYDKSVAEYINYSGWPASKMKEYLNNTWINQAFTSEERKLILNSNAGNTGMSTTTSGDGNKIFLLSREEVNSGYFINNDDRKAEPTDYHKAMRPSGKWWARTAFNVNGMPTDTRALCVGSDDGVIYDNSSGLLVPDKAGVRPAMWVNLPAAALGSSGMIDQSQVDRDEHISINDIDVVSAYIMDDNTLQVRIKYGYQKMNTNVSEMFKGFSDVTEITGLGLFDWSNITDASAMFKDCENLTEINLPANFGKNVTNAESMFENTAITVYPKNLVLDNAVTIKNLFKDCEKLEEITLPENFGAKAEDMSGLFEGTSLKAFPSNISRASVINISRMFANLKSEVFTLDNLGGVDFVKSNVDMSEFFKDSTSLKTINFRWSIFRPVATLDKTNMFLGCTSLVGGEGTVYDPAHVDGEYARTDEAKTNDIPGYYTANVVKRTGNFEWGPNWWTDLGFDEVDKRYVSKINFSYDDVIEFGNYWQDAEDYGNETEDNKEPIKWRVLATKSDSKPYSKAALLVSDKALLYHRYDQYVQYQGWSDSELKNYLNKTWIKDAFSDDEEDKIFNSTAENSGLAKPAMGLGNKVFVLSSEETKETVFGGYFIDEADRKSGRSGYAIKMAPGSGAELVGLRNGSKLNVKTINANNGKYENSSVPLDKTAIRPAMWVSLSVLPSEKVDLTRVVKIVEKKIYADVVVKAYLMDDNSVEVILSRGHQSFGTDMSSMFNGFPNVTEITNIDVLDMTNATDMSNMFRGCMELTDIKLPVDFAKNVKIADSMFENTGISAYPKNLALDSATSMKNLFKSCKNIEELTLPNNFGANAEDMSGMFEGTSLKKFPANMNANKVLYMSRMFAKLQSETLDLSNFANIKTIWDALNMREFFKDSTKLKTIYIGDKNIKFSRFFTDSVDMFSGCTSLVGGEGTRYDENHKTHEYARIDELATNGIPGYFTGKVEKILDGKYTWSSSWWTDLGFKEGDKKNINKIKFSFFQDGFGNYWQDAEDYGNEATADKEPIEWRILATKSNPDRTLIVSKKVLFDYIFDDNGGSGWYYGWEASDLKEYLNNTWINQAFTGIERDLILNSDAGDNNFSNPTTGSGNKVFVLSVAESDNKSKGGYFIDDNDRKSEITAYVEAITPNRNNRGQYWQDRRWWTRTGSRDDNSAICVAIDNGTFRKGDFSSLVKWKESVRPAMWVNIPAEVFEKTAKDLTEVKDIKTIEVYKTPMVNAYLMNDNTLEVELRIGHQLMSEDLSSMFEGFSNVTEITGINVFDWSSSNDMTNLFKDCNKLTSVELPANFGKSATSMSGLFEGTALKEVPANIDGSSAEDISRMFANLKTDALDFSKFADITFAQKDLDASELFKDSTSLKTIDVGAAEIKFDSTTLTESMFLNCTSLVGGAKTKYSGSNVDKEYARVDLYDKPGYFTGKTNAVEMAEYIWMGTYPQNDGSGTQLEPIKWRVLGNNGKEALLIADTVLDTSKYHSSNTSITWADSDIRTWLNEIFATQAFDQIQLNKGILNKTISTSGSQDTTDKVFLLDKTLANRFETANDRSVLATRYAQGKLNNANVNSWWLRSPGNNQNMAAYVNSDGDLVANGNSVNFDYGVRPAIYLDIQSSIFQLANANVTWKMGEDAFNVESLLWSEMDTYVAGQKLPNEKNMVPRIGYKFKGWHINDSAEVYTSIPEKQTGGIVLSPVWDVTASYIWMGTYPQNDATGKQLEPIKWRVLSNDGEEVLLLADSILDNVTYHTPGGNITWADSSIRKWLNDTFGPKAFTSAQLNKGIISKTISTSGSKDTTDKVHLLSLAEAGKMGNMNSRLAWGTPFSQGSNSVNGSLYVQKGVSLPSGYIPYGGNSASNWLLRNSGDKQTLVACVDSYGITHTDYYEVNMNTLGVRPIVYVDLKSSIFQLDNANITWELGDSSFKDGSSKWLQMDKYVAGQKLPDKNNIVEKEGYIFKGWHINNNNTRIYRSIPENQTGDITLTPVWGIIPTLDHIWMGTYPQNDGTGTQLEPIKWKVLSNDGYESLLLSEKILDASSYNSVKGETTWADSDIRAWLNDNFKSKAFTEMQINNGIVDKTIKTLVIDNYYDSHYIDTQDKVFLLDTTQATNMGNEEARIASGSTYAKVNSKLLISYDNGEERSGSVWWLRSPGIAQNYASCILPGGNFTSDGNYVYHKRLGVRPAIYADMIFDGFRYEDNSVTWDLGDSRFATESQIWLDFDAYQGGQKLPNADNMVKKDGYVFKGWHINNSTTIYTSIPDIQTGDITLSPEWQPSGKKYDITWVDEAGNELLTGLYDTKYSSYGAKVSVTNDEIWNAMNKYKNADDTLKDYNVDTVVIVNAEKYPGGKYLNDSVDKDFGYLYVYDFAFTHRYPKFLVKMSKSSSGETSASSESSETSASSESSETSASSESSETNASDESSESIDPTAQSETNAPSETSESSESSETSASSESSETSASSESSETNASDESSESIDPTSQSETNAPSETSESSETSASSESSETSETGESDESSESTAPVERVLATISVAHTPDKTGYETGDVFDPDGLILGLHYNDGSVDNVEYTDGDERFTFDKDVLTKDDTEITVTYAGKTAVISITVKDTTVAPAHLIDGSVNVKLLANSGKFVNGDNTKEEYIKKGESTKKFEIPINNGVKFKEYYVNGEPIHEVWDYEDGEDLEIKAMWEPIYVTVAFNANGGSGTMPVESVPALEDYYAPACAFTRDGYDFAGWEHRFSDDQGKKWYSNYGKGDKLFFLANHLRTEETAEGPKYRAIITENEVIELVATWTPKKFVVKYNIFNPNEANSKMTDELYGASAGGAKYKEEEFVYSENNKLSRNTAVYPGYKFMGWALSTDSSVAFANEAEISTKDMFSDELTLYAVWQKTKELFGTLHLLGNGGTVNGVDDYELDLSIRENIVVPTLERKGYKFTHWSKVTEEGEVEEEIATFPTECDFEEMILKANWEPINYKVRLYKNHGDSSDYEDIDVAYDEHFELPDYTNMYGEEKFIGWGYEMNDVIPSIGTLSSFGTTVYYAHPTKEEIVNIGNPTKDKEVINLYALWAGRTYYITLHDNIHDTNMFGKSNKYTYGYGHYIDGVKTKLATVNNIGYVFSGWATEEVGLNDANASEKVKFYDGQKSDNIFEASDNLLISLYSVWIDKSIGATIVFDANEGTINDEKRRTVKFAYNDKLLFPNESELKRKGYKFAGWLDEVAGVTYQTSSDINIGFVGDRILKAVWTPGEYTINYNKTGEGTKVIEGKSADASGEYFSKSYAGDVKTVIADNDVFERKGYEFSGWDISPAATTVIYKVGDEVDPLAQVDETINLYAVWAEKTYTIQYFNGEGQLIGSNTMLVGKNVRIIPNESAGEEERDAGYDYVVNGITYHFSSGQSVSAGEFKLTDDEIQDDSQMYSSAARNSNYKSSLKNSLFGGALNENIFGTDDDTIKLYGGTANKSYLLSFDANGGSFGNGSTVVNESVMKGESMTGKYPTTPTKAGNTFAGWSIDGTTFSGTTYPYSESMTFTALWNPSGSTNPSNPSDPSNPSNQSDPSDPSNPSNPTNPSNPSNPSNPTNPTNPSNPSNPSNPTNNDGNNNDGNNGGSTGGNNGGSTGGNNGGSTGGNNSGSTGGNNGGSTGGSRGGNNGGSTGGNNGGSTGGNNGGSKGGSAGPGGGGSSATGVGGGGNMIMDLSTRIVNVPIAEKDVNWVLNENKERLALTIKKDSLLAKALLNTEDSITQYTITTNSEYIQLKNGFYNVGFKGGQYYFGLDENGVMRTGLVRLVSNTPLYGVDNTTNKLVKIGAQEEAKYYLMESGDYKGILWTAPIAINYVMYEFDPQGRIVKETQLEGSVNTIKEGNKDALMAWNYDPVTNKLRYYEKDENGNVRYLKNEARGIDYNGTTCYYIFDENGYMMTGLTNYNGDIYYLQETGPLKGAVYVGTITLGGKQYTFNEQGKYVEDSKVVNVKALSLTETAVDAYPVGENGDPIEAKPQNEASPLKTITAKIIAQ